MDKPELRFVETDTEKIAGDMIAAYEAKSGRTLYPADPVRLLLLWAASIDVQARVNLNHTARQNIPRYATGQYLDLLAELFKDVRRLKPAPARTTLRFTLSLPRAAAVVPQGTRVAADGKLVFATAEELRIPAGEESGIVTALCQTAGTAGNGFLPGQLGRLVDVFPFFERVENTTVSAGGADEETDDAFYARMRESMETFSTAGPSGGYEYHAKSASALVADVKATTPAPGTVDVRVLLAGGVLPGAELLEEISRKLTAETVRPLTDLVLVGAPEQVPYNVDVTYYTQNGVRAQDAAAAVAQAAEAYRLWQGEKMGRDINPSQLHFLLMEAGVKRVEVRSPVFTKVADNAVAVAAETIITDGGAEDA